MADGLLDVNVLVALVWPQHVHHVRARLWLRAHPDRFLTTPITESALLRLSMNRAVVGVDVRPNQALDVLDGLRRHPKHGFLSDDSTLAAPRIDLGRWASPRQTTDLHLVNLCASHGVRLVTFDRGIGAMLEPEDRAVVDLIEERRGGGDQ